MFHCVSLSAVGHIRLQFLVQNDYYSSVRDINNGHANDKFFISITFDLKYESSSDDPVSQKHH